MENQGKQRMGMLMMEILWWIITAVVIWMVTRPLWGDFVKYDYINYLMLYIVVFITGARYLFLLKYTFLAKLQPVKVILLFACLPLAFYMIQVFFDFQDFLERQNEGNKEYMLFFRENISFQVRFATIAYLTNVFSFFGMSAIITTIIFPFRMLISFWRVYNKTGMV